MLIAQLTSAAALTLLLFGFYQRFGKGYLRHWAWSWCALTVAHGVEWGRLLPMAGEALVSYVLATAYLSASALSVIWFLFGVYEVTRHYSVRLRVAALTTPVTIVVAAILAFFIYTSPRLIHGALLLPASVSAIAASGWTLYARGKRGAPGLVLFSMTLFALGMVELLEGYLLVAGLPPSSSLTLMAFGCQVAVGLAMIIALLDDEREAAVLAASEIEHLAYNDPLTGLSNRSLFLDRTINALAQATRQHHSVSVLFLDIDRFKTVNDSLGHSFGDALLRAAANRIRDCVRPGDTVARFGGDEFTILLPRVDTVAEASSIAYRILAALRKPFLLAGRELVVTTSIGISIYPADGLDAETLVKNADIAMYRAKEKGRDNCQLFTPELSSRALEKLDLENRLRRALENNELLVYYQPLINVHKQTLYGFEALLRWQHPELGLLAPGSFIEAAEISGLTIPIGDWVIRTACAQARAWQLRFGVDLVVAVNLSARQLHEPELVAQVRDALKESGLAPTLLDLEITETNAMRNAEATLRVLQQLRDLGIHLSMDDFGTGYSSLSYLRRFPVDTLKLDRSFVRDVEKSGDNAIPIAVIEMARALGMRVIAEGVETETQLAFLRQHGCDLAQGFLFSPALPEAACWNFIADHTTARLSTGPIAVPRRKLKNHPAPEIHAPASTREEPHAIVHHKTKSGSLKKTELKESYQPREELINDN